MMYEYDQRKWSKGAAWRHLWACYLASNEYRYHKNPFRKCHAGGPWRWEGPELSARTDGQTRIDATAFLAWLDRDLQTNITRALAVQGIHAHWIDDELICEGSTTDLNTLEEIMRVGLPGGPIMRSYRK